MSASARAEAMLADVDRARGRLRRHSEPRWVELDDRGRIVLRGVHLRGGVPPALAFGYELAAQLDEDLGWHGGVAYRPVSSAAGRAAVARIRKQGYGAIKGVSDVGRDDGWALSIADGTETW